MVLFEQLIHIRVPPDINTPCAIESLRKVSGYPDVRIRRGNVFTA